MNNDERTYIAHWMYANQYNYQVIGLGNVYILKFRTLDVSKDTYRLLYEDDFSYVVQIHLKHDLYGSPISYFKFFQINNDGSLTHLFDRMEENYDELKKIIKLRKLEKILS